MTRTKRHAFTLVEVLFAVAIGFVLLVVIHSLLSGSVQQFTLTQTHLSLTSTAQTVLDTVQDSLAGMIVEPNTSSTFLVPQENLHELTFYVCRADDNGDFYRGHQETFGLQADPSGQFSYFVHNGTVHTNLRLTDLTFNIVRSESIDGTPLFFVQTRVTAIDRVRPGEPNPRTFSLVGLSALSAQTKTWAENHWNPNPFVYKQF